MTDNTVSGKVLPNPLDLSTDTIRSISINLKTNWVKEHFLRFMKELMWKAKIKKNMRLKLWKVNDSNESSSQKIVSRPKIFRTVQLVSRSTLIFHSKVRSGRISLKRNSLTIKLLSSRKLIIPTSQNSTKSSWTRKKEKPTWCFSIAKAGLFAKIKTS